MVAVAVTSSVRPGVSTDHSSWILPLATPCQNHNCRHQSGKELGIRYIVRRIVHREFNGFTHIESTHRDGRDRSIFVRQLIRNNIDRKQP